MKKRPVPTFISFLLLSIGFQACIQSEEQTSDKKWKQFIQHVDSGRSTLTLHSPVFEVNQVYRSMQGPVASHSFSLAEDTARLSWITGYAVKALDPETKAQLSDDFICHSNLDFDLHRHYESWGLQSRINTTYPRLITMTQGQTTLTFPEGFGFPVYTNEPLYAITQVLNHNLDPIDATVMHSIEINYIEHDTLRQIKPLFERSIFVMLPFSATNATNATAEVEGCVPVDPNNHRYEDHSGQVYSGHWVITPGRHKYRYDVTKMMDLEENTTLHYIGVHTHPFAESLTLRHVEGDSVLFKAVCTNFNEKIGLKQIGFYSSKTGIPVFADQHYELIAEVNNTSEVNQDMMASMFLYFYDPEMDRLLKLVN
jgi:hypothetical protein